MCGPEETIDKYVECVEETRRTCELSKHAYANCAVRYTKSPKGDVALDEDAYASHLRPIQRPVLTGAAAEEKATKSVTGMLVNMWGALACALITQVWPMVYVVSLQRTPEPTVLQVRRLNAVTRQAQPRPRKITSTHGTDGRH